MADLGSLLNLFDIERAAEAALSRPAWDYYAGGANDETTMRSNRSAFDRFRLWNRVLVDVDDRTTATTVLGDEIDLPVLVAPTAFHKMAHADGELASARAAEAAGTVMVLSTLSNTPVEDVVAATHRPVWFQLYVCRDRSITRTLIQRAEQAGCKALVVTVDAPPLGRRERDIRNRFHLPDGLRVANLVPAGLGDISKAASDSALSAYATSLDSALTWKDLDWIRSVTALPIVVKGIIHPDDGRLAAEAGVSALVVSNHGGRQLDGAPATIDALEAVVDAVDGRAEVYVDGGFRRGTDIIKALALGARAVLLGRPLLWGLAVSGQAGAEHVLRLLQEEVDLALGLCGCNSPSRVPRSLVSTAPCGGGWSRV